ncbi:MAG: hypothetical protein ABGY96_00755 [bacterium]|nr:hypothetical protein [Gammaproteobacteria bacterium]HIL98500.1 hypothetical protein [Pseudomonadales bacterium]
MNRIILLTGLMAMMVMARPSIAEIEASDYTLTETGVIMEMDIAGKSAIISGYQYGFAGTNGYDLPGVKMVRSNFGSFEMLQVGMKVKITYRASADARIVVELVQLADGTEIGEGDYFLPDSDEPG